ncbi:MAG: ABC transporter substrate-binding protein [Saccharospirillaceae bacterium]|nr:ABC transporter substrate-binding protein [Saccharospirillaceae bacterium]MCD8533130.1 ABC transporter substrate-binding protein [Saccharospirillaceae bacterium]
MKKRLNKKVNGSAASRCLLPALGLLLSLGSMTALAADKVRFQLDWLPGGDKAPVYVGLQQGFFAEQGLEVTVAQGRGSHDAITKLATGNADIGLSDLVALLQAKAAENVPVSAVYSVFSEAPHAFFVRSDSGINSVADVAGKKIATSPFTSSNVFLPLLLDVNKVDETSIKLLKADPGALNPMLLTGNTDVVISWITDSEVYKSQAKEAGKTLTIIPWYDAGLEFYSTAVVASDRFLSERPEVAKRFIKAYAKAIDYTFRFPAESAAAVKAAVPEVDATVAEATIRSINGLVYNDASSKAGLGRFDAERLMTTWNWTAKAQGLDVSSFDPEQAVKRGFIPQTNLSSAE